MIDNIISSTINAEISRRRKTFEKEVEELNSIINNCNKMSFDELYSQLRKIQIKNKEIFWTQLFKESDIFKLSLSCNYSQVPDSVLPINASYVCIEYTLFTLKFNISTFDSPNIIGLKFKTDELQSCQWMKEAILSGDNKPQSFKEFLAYSYSNQNYLNHCLLLNLLEEFQRECSYQKYEDIIKFINTTGLDITDKSTIINFFLFKKNLDSKIKEELSLIKYEHSKEEMYEYGISESKTYFSEAIPFAVSILNNFSNLEERLIIDNYPLSDILKAEIISRIESTNE